MKTRQEMITERRAQVPRKYKRLYDKALKRGNLRAAVDCQCLECVGWVYKEVRLCTDLACPLYVHRRLNHKHCVVRDKLPDDLTTS